MDPIQVILWKDIMRNIHDAEEQAAIRRVVLTQRNPFLLSDEKFIKIFRLNKRVCADLIELVRPFIQEPSRRSALDVETKVFSALRFFGCGSYQEITGPNHYIGISQPSVSRSLREVCDALNRPQIFNQWVSFPQNFEEMQALRNSFFTKYEFPGVIGCVDCTHIAIFAPPTNDDQFPEHVYVNRKNYHSINVQLICDSNLRIMNVNAQFPGSSHDANIWRHSQVSILMENIYRRDPTNVFFLLGDSGYTKRPWLLTPLMNPQPGPQQQYNDKFCSIRALIERCNGVLKNRFRCLLKHRVLHHSPTMASKIINSCVVLHNMCIINNVPKPDIEQVEDIDYGIYMVDIAQDPIGRINPDLTAARQLEETIVQNHFLR